MRYIFFILYLFVVGLHLKDSFYDDKKARNRTKPFLLITLILYYVFSMHTMDYLLLFALIAFWLGDLLLIPKGNKWFILGGISFLIGHIYLVFVYMRRINFQNINVFVVLMIALLYFYISKRIITSIKKNISNKMYIGMLVYLICNGLMNIFAFLQYFSNWHSAELIALIGAILFFMSDCALFLVRYHSDKNIIYKRHFTVMFLYTLSILLITQSIILLTP